MCCSFLEQHILAQIPPPKPATQAEVDAGTIDNKFVSPLTHANYSGSGGAATATNLGPVAISQVNAIVAASGATNFAPQSNITVWKGSAPFIATSYATLPLAIAAAGNGDSIDVHAGTYTLATTDNLLKNGVNWFFFPGAFVTKSNANVVTGVAPGVFDDRGLGAVTSTIAGNGKFFYHAGIAGFDAGTAQPININPNVKGFLVLTNPASRMKFKANRVESAAFYASTVPTYFISDCADGTALEVDDTIDVAYTNGTPSRVQIGDDGGDPVYANDTLAGLWWNQGNMVFKGNNIITTETCIYGQQIVGGTGTRLDYKILGVCSNAHNICIYPSGVAGETHNWTTWGEVHEIHSTGTQGFGVIGEGKHYLNVQKIRGPVGIEVGGTGTAEIWLQAQKVSYTTKGLSSTISAGKTWANINEFEEVASGATAAISVSSGTVELTGQTSVATNGLGILFTGGNLRVMDLKIDTSTGGNTKPPMFISANNAVLQNCVLIAPAGTNCVSAGSAKTFDIYNGLMANLTTNGNAGIRINGGFTVDANVH